MLNRLKMNFKQIVAIFSIMLFFSCDKIRNKQDSPNLHFPKKTLQISKLFSNGAVLQRNTSVNIWGKAFPNSRVRIISGWGNSLILYSNQLGDWSGRLQTPITRGPFSLKIITKNDSIEIKDILIGEVWLASGQSNMEMPLKGYQPNDHILNSKREIKNANYPDIRMFTVEKNFSIDPQNSLDGSWIKTSPEVAENFSATAYFFAKEIHESINVPVGIIHSSWGGSPAEAWTSDNKLKDLDFYEETINNMRNSDPKIIIESWFHKFRSMKFPEEEYPGQLLSNQFKQIEIFDNEFSGFDLDDESWSQTILPGRFDSLVSEQFDGVVWLRKEIAIDDLDSDYELTIGHVDDMDKTFFNGKIIGEHAGYGSWNKKRQYKVPKSILKKGVNVIAIRAIDTGGPGTFGAPMNLSNNEGNTIPIEGEWRYKAVAEIYEKKIYIYEKEQSITDRPSFIKINPFLPTVLFNAMINPVIPYTVKGAIWYQGESNVGRDEQYKHLFPGMIEDWRSRWGEDFPFYYVQIAPYKYGRKNISQKLREAQRYTLKVPNTGMVVTLDIGDNENIHPANKQDVGKRLARLALVNNYESKLEPLGPTLKESEVIGNSIKLIFDHVGVGLVHRQGRINQFEIASFNGKYHDATVEVGKNHITVSSDSVKNLKYVRYAWSDTPQATLFNSEGFPSSSFMVEIK